MKAKIIVRNLIFIVAIFGMYLLWEIPFINEHYFLSFGVIYIMLLLLVNGRIDGKLNRYLVGKLSHKSN
ncbi:hypothetical protein [Lactiplantibacillus mudanjiangensis]|uniref:Uncharacterized protein n=1 Tax=Lactiplantibacillus mudanjiangensis TaxID=1296538 RepID=A0A660DW32_9LACO|nr:hypothetical protein [Lactiplantibacillus mudanjiangensis]VDG19044.1 hypothetical protein MUDAN_BIHEEGNE_00935 [Lactiplantibacillus mudanjiangensis]VDG23234.1 hypothetical protein MUDAN_IGPPGNFN_01862 [Lactiplantibacillus mudanjiangensis]VDG27564.1 hypothetical protein MUDAN_MDHGFNIF_02421 [Lactiplantibacillus mudanjiangensis]VDG33135.1 hypothetical protein MUDAN_DOGOELCO_02342 [Lactiplantibacillus mudanjiangensis]